MMDKPANLGHLFSLIHVYFIEMKTVKQDT